MKKVLAIVAIVMLVPFTAFGMQMMADTALDDVTGQAGVSISIDNVQMDFSIGYVSWGDDDGFAGSAVPQTAGYVNMNAIRMTGIVIDKYLIGNSGIAPINPTLDPSQLSFLTIDVGVYPTSLGSGGAVLTTDTAVKIGVPTLTVYVDTIDPIAVTLTNTAGAAVDTLDTLGTIAMGSMQLDTKGGNIYILAH